MSPWYAAYTSIGSAAFISSFPFLWAYSRLNRRFSKGWRDRLGFLPEALKGLDAPVWFHASSLGEVKAAGPIMAHLKNLAPGCSMLLSVTTDHGFALAEGTVESVPVVYAPFDVLFSVRRALSIARPRVMVFLETELWPAWIVEAGRKGIRCALVNGRISAKSIQRYRKFASFFREVLENIDVFSMITEADRQRILAMGASFGRVEVNGNAKFDLLSRQTDPSVTGEVRRLLSLVPSDPVFVAGSIREGEEEKVIDVFERLRQHYPGIVLVIAPRHLSRTPRIESMLRQRKLHYQLRTGLQEQGARRTAPILVLDTFGELFKLYSVGTINFCGASLVPLGGQNPMEAAAWGKAVFYGPSMEDFLDAKTLLEARGGGVPVQNTADFSEKALRLLNHPEELAAIGHRARQTVEENQGAAEKHARVIARLL